jgi:hypothetical protein
MCCCASPGSSGQRHRSSSSHPPWGTCCPARARRSRPNSAVPARCGWRGRRPSCRWRRSSTRAPPAIGTTSSRPLLPLPHRRRRRPCRPRLRAAAARGRAARAGARSRPPRRPPPPPRQAASHRTTSSPRASGTSRSRCARVGPSGLALSKSQRPAHKPCWSNAPPAATCRALHTHTPLLLLPPSPRCTSPATTRATCATRRRPWRSGPP